MGSQGSQVLPCPLRHKYPVSWPVREVWWLPQERGSWRDLSGHGVWGVAGFGSLDLTSFVDFLVFSSLFA